MAGPTRPSGEPSAQEKRQLLVGLLQKGQQSEETAPLSYGQRALWYLNQIAPDSPAYNILFRARLGVPMDTKRLEWSLEQLLDRHPSLRTTYNLRGVRPTQTVHRSAMPDFEHADLRGAAPNEVDRWLNGFADRPFDLLRGPLLRAAVTRADADTTILSIVVHHIAIDFWSMETLVGELLAFYYGTPLTRRTSSQYLDHVRMESELISSVEV